MPAGDGRTGALSPELRAALDAYRADGSNENWTALSQMPVGELQVIDVLKAMDPEFADPYPLAAADLAESNAEFYQWPALPDPDLVLTAILAMLPQTGA